MNGRDHVLLSDHTLLNALAEIGGVLAAIPKNKENKTRINALTKELKIASSATAHQLPHAFPLTRRLYRERCIRLLQHWRENVERDPGCLSPYLFVIAAAVRVAIGEVD